MASKHPELDRLARDIRDAAVRVGDPDKRQKTNLFSSTGGGQKRHDDVTGALEALTLIRQLRLQVDEQLRQIELVAAQDAFRLGARWGDIAHAAGITRQSAQATYRDRENKPRHQPRRSQPQPLPKQARRPSVRDTNSWAAVMNEED